MHISELDGSKLTDEQRTKLLFHGIKDDGRSGDCIFVVGSSKATVYRLPKAVELYHAGRADKVLFSGGVTWPENPATEANMLKAEAIRMGIPEQDILVENQSTHTKENVLASLLVLDREFYLNQVNRLLVVTSAYHMRRLHLTLQTYMPSWVDFTLCPVNDQNSREDNWFLNRAGRERIIGESNKLIEYVKQGILVDQEIDFGS
ncbi:YdcF family protein [Halalkalibacillus halophilus]|uniref:YdcF family protein n=1 Tax=Halalkalibacillus halophilus TaxID=392827 RepID=UPI000428C3F6|nr:YdcF family protein [Halalkalibacillus halophilus]